MNLYPRDPDDPLYFFVFRVVRETITLSFCIAFLEMIAILALLGFSGFLNAPCGFIMNYLVGGALFYLFQRKAKFKLPSLPSFSLSEKILIMIFITGIWRSIYAASIHSGTDTYLYHLFYPATWITDGHISKVTIMSLTNEYFPIYGELLYGWFMLPFRIIITGA